MEQANSSFPTDTQILDTLSADLASNIKTNIEKVSTLKDLERKVSLDTFSLGFHLASRVADIQSSQFPGSSSSLFTKIKTVLNDKTLWAPSQIMQVFTEFTVVNQDYVNWQSQRPKIEEIEEKKN